MLSKKTFLKIIFLVLGLFILLGLSNTTKAANFENIDLSIYVDEYGTGHVREKWIVNYDDVDEDYLPTELYHPYYNLGNSEIINLSVSDNNGNEYETIDKWDVNKSFNEKIHKCGFHEISKGVEICWGISSYQNTIYTVQYDITNFVSNLTDGSQMIYWTLIPHDFSSPINYSEITIYGAQTFDSMTPVWGYGNKGGICRINNVGEIYMCAQDGLTSNQYMTILARFPEGTFSGANNNLNHDFGYYLEMAEKDADHYEKLDKAEIIGVFSFIGIVFAYLIALMIALIVNNSPRRIKKDLPYFRDIPCNGDIFRAYAISRAYRINPKESDFLGALLLKWQKDEIIDIRNVTDKKNQTEIYFLKGIDYQFDNKHENKLYKYFVKASQDNILSKKEFKKYGLENYGKLATIMGKLLKEETAKLHGENLIKGKNPTYFKTPKKKEMTEKFVEEANKLMGLKKYLKEYSLIEERRPIEVKLFEDYLVFAQLLGIADKVKEQFSKIYPDMIESTPYKTYDNYTLFINTSDYLYRSSGSSYSSYSSGGGGFSSGGGGGGSFGGGGGRRRRKIKQYKD